MRKLALLMFIFFSSYSYADKGEVIKEGVCGYDNYIIETKDNWYVALERNSGAYLYKGDIVFGKLKSYGYQEITKSNGDTVNVYIEDYEASLGSALEELCD